MEMPGDAKALPAKRNRTTIQWYAVIDSGKETKEIIAQCDSLAEAKKFVASLPDPSIVTELIRVSAVLSAKKKVVYAF